jgi:hypothetical protein
MKISSFITSLEKSGGLASTNRFKLVINLPPSLQTLYQSSPRLEKHLQFVVQTASIPSKTLSTNSVLAPGAEQKYPYAPEMEDLTVSFLCTRDYIERAFIDDWMNTIVIPSGGSFFIGYRNEYSAWMALQVFANDNSSFPAAVYKFNACFPISASAIDLSHEEQGDAPTFEVVFQIDYWEQMDLAYLPEEYSWDEQKDQTSVMSDLANKGFRAEAADIENPRATSSVMAKLANKNFKYDYSKKETLLKKRILPIQHKIVSKEREIRSNLGQSYNTSGLG